MDHFFIQRNGPFLTTIFLYEDGTCILFLHMKKQYIFFKFYFIFYLFLYEETVRTYNFFMVALQISKCAMCMQLTIIKFNVIYLMEHSQYL